MIAGSVAYAVHDLHLWTISSDRPALSAHLVVHDLRQCGSLLADSGNVLARYGIAQFTLQPEPEERIVREQAQPPRPV